MRTKSLLPLLVAVLLCAAVLSPVALMQQRGLTTGAVPTTSAGRYYALVIGNNAYTALPKLKTAETDAREIERLLKDSYGFQTKLLVNATRAQIVSALSTYRRELPPDANLLIYYAGHGYNDKATEKTYWLPVDAERDDSANWIIADEITSGIRAIPAQHVLVVSDSCYSGTLTRGLGEMLPRPTEREQFLQRMAAGHSRTLMASGGDEPVADSGGSGHSVFADALLRGLREMDKGQFTAAELFRNYVEESVAGRAQQTPEYNPLRNSGHESGDFIFVKVKVGDKAVEVTVKAPATVTVDPAAFELEYWNAIKDSSDPEEYRGYLAKYPNGQFADIARRRAAGGRGGNGTAGNPAGVNLDDFTGTYRMIEPVKNDIEITRDQFGLSYQVVGQDGKPRMLPTSASSFQLQGTTMKLTFSRDAQGRVTQFTLDQAGQQGIARKLSPEPSPTPASPAPTPANATSTLKPPIAKTGLVKALEINGLSTAELVEQIELRGVNFELTPDIEQELRRAGAQDAVIAAVRRSYRKK
ncbi:MAG: caspase domain-containing protein [Pyrinomonadaceae bacterium]